MPAEDGAFSLVIAHSVFTHTIQAHAEYYLREITRVMRPDGMLYATFFLFEKRYFPMMQDFQNALYINVENPWKQREIRNASDRLFGVEISPKLVRVAKTNMILNGDGHGGRVSVVPLPEDRSPFGRLPPPA